MRDTGSQLRAGLASGRRWGEETTGAESVAHNSKGAVWLEESEAGWKRDEDGKARDKG